MCEGFAERFKMKILQEIACERGSACVTVMPIEWKIYFYYVNIFTGNEIIDLISQENDIYAENVQRITVDTDWADGLISR